MQKVIFKFTAVIASALAGVVSTPKIGCPKLILPEIRVERTKSADSLNIGRNVSNRKTVLS